MLVRATVTGKNQITLPVAVARALQIEPGMQVEFEYAANGERVALMRPVLTRVELARQIQGKWRHLLKPGDDPVAELIREREEEDEERDSA